MIGGACPIVGIGTVELQVPRGPNDPEVHTLVLENVAHIPSAMCNAVTIQELGHTVYWGEIMTGYEREGRPAWYTTKFCGLGRLVLPGNPQGESHMNDDGSMGYALSVYLDEENTRRPFASAS